MSSALLSLRATTGRGGRTRVATVAQRFPLRTTSAMYLEAGDPGMAHIYLQNPSGALFDGDSHRVCVEVGRGARLHLTTQSAARIAAASTTGTSQTFDFSIADGAYLEHIPDALVPMNGASFRQQTTVRLRGEACYLGAELLAPGRSAHGEEFAYSRVRLATILEHEDGGRCRDALDLQPPAVAPTTAGVLGTRPFCATLLVAGPSTLVRPLLEQLRALARQQRDVIAGATELPDGLGILVRILADRAPTIRVALRSFVDAARLVLAGLPPADVRK